MNKKQLQELAENQQNLIAEADVYLEELKYLVSEKETELEKALAKHRPFTTIEISFSRTLLLLYSYLISKRDNDYYRLDKTLWGLQQSKKKLTSWSIDIDLELVQEQLGELDKFRSKTSIMEIRDKLIAHLDNKPNKPIDIDELEDLQKLLNKIKETTLSEINKLTVTPILELLNLRNHLKKCVEMNALEKEYWELKPKTPNRR